jgi:iron complex outermembrane receptor protein
MAIHRGCLRRCVALLGVSIMTLPVVQAQDEAGLEEITVTAERRAENVQDVPIAITAVTSETLVSKGIVDVAGLANIAPNVQLDAGTPFSGSDTVLAAYIRGIGQNDFAFNQDPGVGVYVDGVYLARSVGSNTSMLDVERVEILKGPQGTLFGRNTIGGAISIVTRDPGEEFLFKGSVTGGSFNRLDVQGSADLPISERVRSSISFSSTKRDGYQRRIPFTDLTNIATIPGNAGLALIPDCGAPGATCNYITDDSSRFPAADYASNNREGGVNQWSARGKLVFLPNDAVKLTLSADYQSIDQSASPNTIIGVNPDAPMSLGGVYNACLVGAPIAQICSQPRGGLSPTPVPMALLPPLSGANVNGNSADDRLPYDARFETGDIDTSYATGNSFSKLKNWGVAATLEWELNDNASLKSITAYRDLHWQTGMDLDGSPLPILEPSFDMPQHEFSQELVFNGSALGERLTYTIGAYYFEEGGHLHDWVIFPGGLLMVDGPNDLDTEAKALFTHVNYRITDRFGVTLGARYTDEVKHFEGHQHDDNGLVYKISGCFPADAPSSIIGGPANLTCQQLLGFPSATEPYRFYPPGVNTLDFSNTSPLVGFDFHLTDDMMLYGSYSKGYKTGSWTTRLSDPHPVYDDLPNGESSLDFDPEHATAMEVGLKSELLDRKLRLNLAAFHTQYDDIQLNSQQGISPTLVNAGDARIYGLEAEATAIFGGFSFTGALGWTNAKYTRLGTDIQPVVDNGALLTLDSCPLRTSDPDDACDLPKTPEYKVYLGPQYKARLGGGGSLTFNADWTYTAELFNDLGNEERLKRDATNIVNASVSYGAADERWSVSIGGTNLTDERYIVTGQNQGGVQVINSSFSRPREFYVTLRVNM